MSNNAAFSNNVVSLPNNHNGCNGILHQSKEIKWINSVHNKINDLLKLNSGWDGYNAPSIHFEIGQFCSIIINSICSDKTLEPFIVPTLSGGIQIEWHHNNIHLEILINELYDVDVYLYGDTIEDIELHIDNVDYTTILQYMNYFTENYHNEIGNAA